MAALGHTERAQLALTKLAENDPAFAGWSLWCKHHDSDLTFAPAWTDGKTISYAKAFEKFTPDEKIAVAAHEIFHVAFRHPARGAALARRLGPEYKHKTFNIAIDAIVNETLRAANYKLPKSAIFLVDILDKFLGIKATAEESISEYDSEKLYMLLVKQKMSKTKENQKNGGKGQGQGQGQNQPQNGQGNQPQNGQGQQPQGGQKPQNGQGQGQGNKPEPGPGEPGYDPTASEALEEWAKEMGYEGDLDEQAVQDIANQGESDDSMEETEWAQRVARGLAQGKLAGQGIGKLGYKIADLIQTVTPWEQILRALVQKAVTRQPTPSYMRPTKTFLAMDAHAMAHGIMRPVYEQGVQKIKGVPRVAVGVDVSGSIDNRTLRVFASEIASIGKKTGAEIHVLVFDTEVLTETKMKGDNWDSEITKLEFARGGGTDFKPVIKRAMELEPSIIVILTDLYADFGPEPKCKVVWAVEEEGGPTPPFGRVVMMNR